jgi:hypothetical protein
LDTFPTVSTGLYALRRLRGSGGEKPQSALRAFVRFFSATFWAGVNATHCPITRPKRRIQPERYAQLFFELVDKIIEKLYIKAWRRI